LGKSLADVFHEEGGSVGPYRRHEHMNVVGHQDVCVDLASAKAGQLVQQAKIYAMVAIFTKARKLVVAALYDVERQPRESEAGMSGHCGVPEACRQLTPAPLRRKTSCSA
jgi:hypothetical protein